MADNPGHLIERAAERLRETGGLPVPGLMADRPASEAFRAEPIVALAPRPAARVVDVEAEPVAAPKRPDAPAERARSAPGRFGA